MNAGNHYSASATSGSRRILLHLHACSRRPTATETAKSPLSWIGAGGVVASEDFRKNVILSNLWEALHSLPAAATPHACPPARASLPPGPRAERHASTRCSNLADDPKPVFVEVVLPQGAPRSSLSPLSPAPVWERRPRASAPYERGGAAHQTWRRRVLARRCAHASVA